MVTFTGLRVLSCLGLGGSGRGRAEEGRVAPVPLGRCLFAGVMFPEVVVFNYLLVGVGMVIGR